MQTEQDYIGIEKADVVTLYNQTNNLNQLLQCLITKPG